MSVESPVGVLEKRTDPKSVEKGFVSQRRKNQYRVLYHLPTVGQSNFWYAKLCGTHRFGDTVYQGGQREQGNLSVLWLDVHFTPFQQAGAAHTG